jgi:uncharacterized membrane protein
MDTQETAPAATGANARTIVTVPAGRAVDWYKAGFEHFKRAPGPWAIATVVLLAGGWALSLLGVWLGGFLTSVLGTLAWGEMIRFCRNKDPDASGPAPAGGPVWGLAIASGLLGLALQGLAYVAAMAGGLLGIASLVSLVVAVLFGMAFWLAAPLVVLEQMDTVGAIKLSFQAAVTNIGAYLVAILLLVLLAVPAVIPIGLGLLVLIPVFICSEYAAYKEILPS